jgi:hypothetical protein
MSWVSDGLEFKIVNFYNKFKILCTLAFYTAAWKKKNPPKI